MRRAHENDGYLHTSMKEIPRLQTSEWIPYCSPEIRSGCKETERNIVSLANKPSKQNPKKLAQGKQSDWENAKKLKAHQLTWQRANPLFKRDSLISFCLFCKSKGLGYAQPCGHALPRALKSWPWHLCLGCCSQQKKPMACTCAAKCEVKLCESSGSRIYRDAQARQQNPLLMLSQGVGEEPWLKKQSYRTKKNQWSHMPAILFDIGF